MAKFKDFSFFWGENENGKGDTIASILIEPGELILDPAGWHKGHFMEMDISREKLKEILQVLDEDFDSLARNAINKINEEGK